MLSFRFAKGRKKERVKDAENRRRDGERHRFIPIFSSGGLSLSVQVSQP